MKKILFCILVLALSSAASAQSTLQPVGSKVMVSSSKVLTTPSSVTPFDTVPNRNVPRPQVPCHNNQYYSDYYYRNFGYGYGNYYQNYNYGYNNAGPNYNTSGYGYPQRDPFPYDGSLRRR